MDYEITLTQLYQDFNDRNISAILPLLDINVRWPNGWEGGNVQGHDKVRAYWLRQWSEIDPKVIPVSFQVKQSGEVSAGVHQVIKDLNGHLLSDSHVIHTYSFHESKVIKMVIE